MTAAGFPPSNISVLGCFEREWGVMASYRIYRLKEPQRQQFRWAPHTSGVTEVRRKDYDDAGLVDAASVYALWTGLRATEHPLRVGDLVETDDGQMRICKYVGFEEARWAQTEARPATSTPIPPAVAAAAQDTASRQ